MTKDQINELIAKYQRIAHGWVPLRRSTSHKRYAAQGAKDILDVLRREMLEMHNDEAVVLRPLISGWRFFSADFSASQKSGFGSVTIVRDPQGRIAWNSLSEELQEAIPLHLVKRGATLAEAWDACAAAAREDFYSRSLTEHAKLGLYLVKS